MRGHGRFSAAFGSNGNPRLALTLEHRHEVPFRGPVAGSAGKCPNGKDLPNACVMHTPYVAGAGAPIDGLWRSPYGPPPVAPLIAPHAPFGSPHPDPVNMPLTDLVAPQAVIPALRINNKKQAIQELAARAAELTGENEREILEILQQREKLGSTGIGNGIAIPHGKLPKLERLFGMFARLDRPIDFEALDGQPVDLVFLLLAPEPAGADHLKALARVARLMRTPDIAKLLRESRDAEAIYAVLTRSPTGA
jgi:PTS system nitrogen regulatory IIA component